MFVFESHTHGRECLVLFLGQYVPSTRASLTSEIQKAYDHHLTPDLVIFLYPGYLCTDVDELFGDSAFTLDVTRQKHSPVICMKFDANGKFSIGKCLQGGESIADLLDLRQLSRDIIKSGYTSLMEVRSEDIIVKAPAGTTFVKPSGQILDEFIYASQLARNSFEHQFLALSLLCYAPPINNIDCIYIDTSSIAAVAEAIIYYISRFQEETCKHIKYTSFSSYSGLEENKPDNSDGAWVVISASASTSMGKQIVKEWNIKPEQVVTMLSYKSVLSIEEANIGNAVVFSVNDYSNRDDNSFSPTKVQVQGESFSAEISNPEQIVLRGNHKPKSVNNAIHLYHRGSVFSVNRKSRRLHVDYLYLRRQYINNKGEIEGKIFEWMKQIVEWSIPRNLKAIVISNDSSDDKLLDDFRRVLLMCDFNLKESGLRIIDPEDHEKLQDIKDDSVLVLSPAISSGNYFVDVNRALRLAGHKGMRVFATPFVTPSSKQQFERFKKSLTQGTNGFSYGFHSFKTAYVGNKKYSSWDEEKKFITNLINNVAEDAPGLEFWLQRKSQLERQGVGLQGKPIQR